MKKKTELRCPWAKSELEIQYHDHEWCKPLHDDQAIFEMLILEGMQAGLSWSTILNKRENMRAAFDGFDPVKAAAYDDKKIATLLADTGIIRNRAKLQALVINARQFLRLQKEHGSFDRYIWAFVEGQPIVNMWERMEDMPATDEVSDRISKALKAEGFKFVGSTICYSFMQAIGMVNDHLVSCAQYSNCRR